MKRLLPIIGFMLLVTTSLAQSIEKRVIYSPQVKDSFLLQIRIPANYQKNKSYHHIYLADGSLKMGNYVLGKDSSWRASIPENCIIITIAHFGDYSMKRQRDFLPSDAGGYSDPKFGRAQQFYLFLKNTLIPSINKQFGAKKSSAFIGHSFSGLFCVYTLFQEDKLFDRHFAISPSIWANYNELMKMEVAHAKKSKRLHGNLDLLAGGLEVFNKVLSSTTKFYNQTLERKYEGYKVSFNTVNNANHYSIIKPGVDRALANYR